MPTSACVILYRHIVQDKPFRDVYPEAFEFEHDPGKNRAMSRYLLDWAPRISAPTARAAGSLDTRGSREWNRRAGPAGPTHPPTHGVACSLR